MLEFLLGSKKAEQHSGVIALTTFRHLSVLTSFYNQSLANKERDFSKGFFFKKKTTQTKLLFSVFTDGALEFQLGNFSNLDVHLEL